MERREGQQGQNLPSQAEGVEGKWEKGRTAEASTDGTQVEIKKLPPGRLVAIPGGSALVQ